MTDFRGIVVLTGEQTENLCEALIEIFTNPVDFERLVWFRFGRDIRHIGEYELFPDKVFRLVRIADVEGWVDGLVSQCRNVSPEHVGLLQVARALGIPPSNSTASKVGHLENLIESSLRRNNRFIDVSKWRTRLKLLENRVCLIDVEREISSRATGFLVGPDLVLTNYHVLEEEIVSLLAGNDLKFKVTFSFDLRIPENGRINIERHQLAEDWLVDWSPHSPADKIDTDKTPALDELDYALVRIRPDKLEDNSPPVSDRGWISLVGKPTEIQVGDPIYILQHPAGGLMKLAIETRGIISTNPNQTRIRHRANTLTGSSGAPCFNEDLEPIAIHQGAVPPWNPPADRIGIGIPLKTIRVSILSKGIELP